MQSTNKEKMKDLLQFLWSMIGWIIASTCFFFVLAISSGSPHSMITLFFISLVFSIALPGLAYCTIKLIQLIKRNKDDNQNSKSTEKN